jgi:hypothetical protein
MVLFMVCYEDVVPVGWIRLPGLLEHDGCATSDATASAKEAGIVCLFWDGKGAGAGAGSGSARTQAACLLGRFTAASTTAATPLSAHEQKKQTWSKGDARRRKGSAATDAAARCTDRSSSVPPVASRQDRWQAQISRRPNPSRIDVVARPSVAFRSFDPW